MKRVLIVFIVSLLRLIDGFLECSQNSDCADVLAKCEESICQCPSGYVFNLDGSACLPIVTGIQAQCEDDRQCGWLLGKYRCQDNKCECDEGWRYYQGRCIKAIGLHQDCNEDYECYNGYDILAMICKDKQCECNDGYYLRGDYDCRPKATEPTDFCSLDSDCKIDNTICAGSLCKNKTETARFTVVSLEKENLSAIDSIHTGYEIDCTTNDDCSNELLNSMCYPLTKKCICKRGYVLTSSGECIAELGTNIGCKNDADCKITHAHCVDGTCFCPKTYFTAKGNNACQKPMTHDNLFCNSVDRCYTYGTEVTCIDKHCLCKRSAKLDSDYICRTIGCDNQNDCTAIINSECSQQTRVCECPENYRLEKTTCLPNVGAPCDDKTKLCAMENSVCGDDGTCACLKNFVSHENTQCFKISAGLDSKCEVDAQCSAAIKYSACVQGTCTCTTDYIAKNETCRQKKFMGDTCTDVTECHVMLESNVLCRNGKCQCSADAKPSEDELDCYSSTSMLLPRAYIIVLLMSFYLSLKLIVFYSGSIHLQQRH